jgi:hypothetical protein
VFFADALLVCPSGSATVRLLLGSPGWPDFDPGAGRLCCIAQSEFFIPGMRETRFFALFGFTVRAEK